MNTLLNLCYSTQRSIPSPQPGSICIYHAKKSRPFEFGGCGWLVQHKSYMFSLMSPCAETLFMIPPPSEIRDEIFNVQRVPDHKVPILC
jgi:hypothetical protein